MRVFYIGSLQSTACATFYLNAMRDLGFQVESFDPQYFATENPIEKFVIRLRKGPSRTKVRSVGDAIVSHCRKYEFDAIFVMSENFLDAATIAEIRALKNPSPLFLYHSHDNNFSNGICKPKDFFDVISKYDFVFTTKSHQVPKYKKLGQAHAYFLPSAFDPNVHYAIAPESSIYGKTYFDVTFVGTYDKSRDRFLEAAGWDRLHVWGNDWKRYKKYRAHQDRITPQAIYLDEFSDVVSHSHISLGLLREEAEDLHTQRTFEIPACRSLQLAPRNEEILTFFEEGKEIACFSSIEEMKDKIDYYLSHQAECEKIVEAAYRRCFRDHHTYLDRVQQMFAIVGNESGRWSSKVKSA